MKNNIFNLPNLLSFSRLPLAILIIVYSSSSIKYLYFGLAIFSDFLDGYIARKFNQTSKWGGLLDSLFDKIFAVLLFFFFFLKLNLPSYYILFFLLRDIFTIFAVVVAFASKLDKNMEIKARLFGKIVTILQFTTLVFMIAEEIYLIKIGMYAVFVISIIAIIDYIKYANGILKNTKQ